MAVVGASQPLSTLLSAFPPPWRRIGVYAQNQPAHDVWDWQPLDSVLGGLGAGGSDPEVVDPVRVIAYRELNGAPRFDALPTSAWFDDVHTLPRAIDLGLVVATVRTLTEVFNAYRRVDQEWSSWTNYGGPGIDIVGETLPELFAPHSGSGLDVEVEVTTEGEPVVDSYMEYGWTTAGINVVTIRFTRVVPLSTSRGLLIPEDEIVELLKFRTGVLRRADGKEQRDRQRQHPRQEFEHVYKIPNELVASELRLKLANLQHRLWSVGVWEHEVYTTVDVTAGDTVLTVGPTTNFSDFRANGTCAIFIEDGPFDIRGIDSVTASTVVLSNGLQYSYPAGSRVVPLRAAWLDAEIEGARFPVGMESVPLRFEVEDNAVDLADVSAWPSYLGKVLLEGFNFQGRTAPVGLSRLFRELDGLVGKRYRESDERLSRVTGQQVFLTKTREANWNVRQLLHAIGGRHQSWYTLTFREDLRLFQKLDEDDDRLYIEYTGYSENAQGRTPFDQVRVLLKDGTTYDRGVLEFGVDPSGESETLVVDAVWPTTIEVEEVDRVMFIFKVRFDSDTIRIQHRRGGVVMRTSAPVIGVLE